MAERSANKAILVGRLGCDAETRYALRLKEATPQRTWTELTFLAGYFDQNHMVKDFKALAGTAPSEFFRLIEEGFQPRRAR
jgi:hypothetical protein